MTAHDHVEQGWGIWGLGEIEGQGAFAQLTKFLAQAQTN